MQANIAVEVHSDDISYHLREVITDLVGEEIKVLTNTLARDMVQQEIDKILEPLVISVLTKEEFSFNRGYDYYHSGTAVKGMTRLMVKDYLDQPCYSYSQSSNKPSGRLKKSSSRSDPSRLEQFLRFAIERYFDEHIEAKMADLTKNYLQGKEAIEEIAKQKMTDLLGKLP